ncbi:MAG: FAD binding domain-containing protein [Acidobacteriota bacterium]
MTTIERYAVPRSLEEVTQILAEGTATMFAGGTDLLPQTRAGLRPLSPLLVNICRIDALRKLYRHGDTFRIGALTTISEILESRLLKEHAKVLVDTANCFASGQVRNSATLGGNICNASPAGDMIIPLLLLDAEVGLASQTEGELTRRSIPLRDFFLGPGKTRILPSEILTHIQFELPEEGFVAGFKKFGTRPALDIAVASVGIAGTKDNGVMRKTRVAFGAVAPIPLRGTETEAALEGEPLEKETIARVARIAEEEVSPISDVRGSAWYRKQLVRTLTERLLRHVS